MKRPSRLSHQVSVSERQHSQNLGSLPSPAADRARPCCHQPRLQQARAQGSHPGKANEAPGEGHLAVSTSNVNKENELLNYLSTSVSVSTKMNYLKYIK